MCFYVVSAEGASQQVFDQDASQPVSVQNGVMRFKIGSTAYVVDGYTIQIICNPTRCASKEYPITISWLHNGEPDQTRGNMSMITVTDANHGDVFTCIANNTAVPFTQYTRIIFVHYQFCI